MRRKGLRTPSHPRQSNTRVREGESPEVAGGHRIPAKGDPLRWCVLRYRKQCVRISFTNSSLDVASVSAPVCVVFSRIPTVHKYSCACLRDEIIVTTSWKGYMLTIRSQIRRNALVENGKLETHARVRKTPYTCNVTHQFDTNSTNIFKGIKSLQKIWSIDNNKNLC